MADGHVASYGSPPGYVGMKWTDMTANPKVRV